MTKRSVETFFDISAGMFSGVFLRKRLMKRVLKLQDEYNTKVRQLLAASMDELQTSNWTLNNNQTETGLQITGHYFDPNETDEMKLRRIELFKHEKPTVVEYMFESESYDEVREKLSLIAIDLSESK